MPSISPSWSEKDELSLLGSILEIANEPAESYNPRVNLFDRIGMNLENSFSNRDVLEKARELRRRYKELCRKMREGDGVDSINWVVYKVCTEIWGDRGEIIRPKKKKKEDKEMATPSMRPGAHQLTSQLKRGKDSKSFQHVAHQLASKQKRSEVFRNFQPGTYQSAPLPLPPIWRPEVFRNVQLGSSQPLSLCLPLMWRPHNAIGLHPPLMNHVFPRGTPHQFSPSFPHQCSPPLRMSPLLPPIPNHFPLPFPLNLPTPHQMNQFLPTMPYRFPPPPNYPANRFI